MTQGLTAGILRAIAPGASEPIVQGIVDNQQTLYLNGIDTPLRLAHFLGQSAYETMGFTRLEENLRYTTAARLVKVFPAHFKTAADAAPYVNEPEKLANRVYADANRAPKYQLGNPNPGDGWRNRGSGMKMVTGGTNLRAFFRAIGMDEDTDPAYLRSFPGAIDSAAIYFRLKGIAEAADRDDVAAVTKLVQGGALGLADRRIFTDRAKIALRNFAIPPMAAPAPAGRPSNISQPTTPGDTPSAVPPPSQRAGGAFASLASAIARMFSRKGA